LSLGVCDIHQVGVGEPRRELQDRLGNGDVVVVGKRAQNLDRRVGQRSKMLREFGARLALDLFDQERENVVEKIDMRIVVWPAPSTKSAVIRCRISRRFAREPR
jgi:hypothetical protein